MVGGVGRLVVGFDVRCEWFLLSGIRFYKAWLITCHSIEMVRLAYGIYDASGLK